MLSVNCTLTSLNLGWNSLRMASAVTVADSLRDNHTLVSLGLAYNSFSDFATQVNFPPDSCRRVSAHSPAFLCMLSFSLVLNCHAFFTTDRGNLERIVSSPAVYQRYADV